MYDESESQQLNQNENDDEDSYIEESRSPRFVQWFAFLMFSLICLGSAIEASEHQEDPRAQSNQKWAVACAAISFSLTTVVVLLHMSPITSIFIVNTRFEGMSIFILIAFWAASANVVSNAGNGLAVNETGAVVYGNLYYFTWGGFVCSITLLVSYLRSVYYIDVREELKLRSARLNYWTALVVFCLVMMASSAGTYDQYCSGNSGSSFCSRTTLAVVIGAAGSIFSLIMIGVKIGSAVVPFQIEAGFSFILFFGFSFGVAFITSEKGPGAPLGNLYYSTWAAFACTFLIGSSLIEEHDTARKKRMEENAKLAPEEEFAPSQDDYMSEYSKDDLQSLDQMSEKSGQPDGMLPGGQMDDLVV